MRPSIIWDCAASPRHKPKIRLCPICGKEYTRPQSGSYNRCPICIGIALASLPKKPKSECSLQVIRAHARGIIRRLGKTSCQVCGYTHRVDCCHIKPIKLFPSTALVSEINAVENLAALCPNHHIELDLGILKMVGDGNFEIPASRSQTERSASELIPVTNFGQGTRIRTGETSCTPSKRSTRLSYALTNTLKAHRLNQRIAICLAEKLLVAS